MKDKDRIEWPLIQLFNELLKPNGYRKMGRHWRKDAEETMLALVLDNIMGTDIFAIRFGAWLKALGEVALKDVEPVLCQTHIYMNIIDPCPEPLQIKIERALHFNFDYFDTDLDEDWGTAIEDVDTSEPLTDQYRVETIREAMENYALPVLKQMETAAGLRSILEQGDLDMAVDESLYRHLGVPIVDKVNLTLF